MGLSAILLALWCAACSGATFVDKVVIDNPTAFTVKVDVSDQSRSGWLGLTTVEARSERTVEEVIDQGSTWIIRFSYSDYEEEIELSRAELERSGWRVEVPDSFAGALRDRGIRPPP